MGRHALLSASSSHRWLACPPSARLCENYEDTGSEYAQQGTDAHSLCEYKLKLSLGMEDEIKTAFVTAYNRFLEDQDEIIRNMETVIGQLSDNSGLEMEREKLEQEMTVLAEMVRNCVAENARTAMDQGKYQERYSGLAERYETLKEKHDKVSGEIAARTARSQMMGKFLDTLKKNGVVEEFDEVLWGDIVDYVTVDCEKKLVFTFRNGVEINI